MREAKRERINLGPYSKINLLKVSRGEQPLSCWIRQPVLDYMARIRAERDVARRPWRVQIGPGGLRLVRRTVDS